MNSALRCPGDPYTLCSFGEIHGTVTGQVAKLNAEDRVGQDKGTWAEPAQDVAQQNHPSCSAPATVLA